MRVGSLRIFGHRANNARSDTVLAEAVRGTHSPDNHTSRSVCVINEFCSRHGRRKTNVQSITDSVLQATGAAATGTGATLVHPRIQILCDVGCESAFGLCTSFIH